MELELRKLAKSVADRLEQSAHTLVLAESCTGGLVAATLAQIPGISRLLCGSMVTYQDDTKHLWLQIPAAVLVRPGPVSEQVAGWMAERVLAKTPHASHSAAVTGHLGPQAPARLDGVVYVAVSVRHARADRFLTAVVRHRLKNSGRRGRQTEATRLVLQSVRRVLKAESP